MLGVQFTYFAAIRTSNAATATVLQYLGPVFIALWYAWSDKRVPRPLELVAIFLAVAGTVLLVTHGDLSSLAISLESLIWGLLSAVTLAYYSIRPVPLLRRFNSAVVVGWGMLIGGVVISFIHPPWHVSGTWDLAAFGSATFIVLLGSLAAFYAYLSSVGMIGANTASLLACAEPLSATIVAVAWLGVPFGTADWLGTLFILATIALLTWSERGRALD
jgi:drug/metabolite transporter (DMT)-like permease